MPATSSEVALAIGLCHGLVRRLVDLLYEYRIEIVDEFYYMPETKQDWLQMFRNLRKAARHLLRDPRTGQEEPMRVGGYVAYIDNQLYDAIQALNRPSDPVDAIFEARSLLTKAYDASVDLREQCREKASSSSAAIAQDVLPGWLDGYRKSVDEFARTVESKDQKETCRSSRKSYLFRTCCFALLPGFLPAEVERRLWDLNFEAMGFLEGKYREHTQRRHARLCEAVG